MGLLCFQADARVIPTRSVRPFPRLQQGRTFIPPPQSTLLHPRHGKKLFQQKARDLEAKPGSTRIATTPKNTACMITSADSSINAKSTFPFLFRFLIDHMGDNPIGDVTIFPQAVCQIYFFFYFFNTFNLNFHVLNVNLQTFDCFCRSPLHSFQPNDMPLAAASTKLMVTACYCSNAQALCPPTAQHADHHVAFKPRFELPPSRHFQHILQHSRSPALFLSSDRAHLGLFLAGGIRGTLSELISNLALLAVFQSFQILLYCIFL